MRATLFLTFEGRTASLKTWASELNTCYFKLRDRYRKNWPAEYVLYGRPKMPTRDPVARFWECVERSDGCWIWKGHITTQRYGQVYDGRLKMAHRYSYELLVGPIPTGLVLDHLCRTPLCVNPDHLEPVTTAENNRRGFGASGKNYRKTVCIRGHDLSGDNIRWIGPHLKYRRCRECEKTSRTAWRQKRRAAGLSYK